MPPLVLALLLSPPPLLTFSGLLEDKDGRLVPSPKLLAASGKRVRLKGFVAEMERPPKGGFWLCPRPVETDESGGGTADLPLESVFVVVRSSPETVFRSPHGAVEVTGVLQLGPLSLPDGTMTRLRLVLDRPVPGAAKKVGVPSKSHRKPLRS